ncbi:kinesin-like protein KIF2A [Folsomia candida]|uniref:kinesin-like protein KIF2A n=1 Tax=Folsomia candida TaxID=158441 RepID=UPI000B8F47B7|nr:kinesin-like protein KIF2A [Folsomia candida]
MEASVIYSIGLGMQVNIKRTDGRVHTAVVSGINWETKSVTVEWFERNETKGKEIDIEALTGLNPNITTKNVIPNNTMTNGIMAMDQTLVDPHNVTANINYNNGTTTQNNNQGGGGRGGKNDMKPPPDRNIPAAAVTKNQLNAGNGTTVGAGGRIPRGTRATQHVVAPALPPQTRIEPPPQIVEDDAFMEVSSNGTGGTVTRGSQQDAAASRRRSNVVKEVEKLKKNREERRMRQAELKNEKENLMNIDPGNPNWEFLSMIREYQQDLQITPLRDSDPVEDHQITVCVRKRPMNKKEINRKEVDVITVPLKNTVTVHEPKQKVDLTKYLENQHFRYDYAFDESCTNEMVYKYTARPLVQTIFEGGMATCFAYGQTGSGKTHTMGGDFNGKTQDCVKGIYAMTAKDVFRLLNLPAYRPLALLVSCSFFEIYSGKVFDLLASKAKLRVLEDGKQQVQVVGLTERSVETVEDVLKLIQVGNSARTSGQTSANSNSSRSHAVFQIILRTPMAKLHGKFSLIDLAGNERGADTSSADRQTRMEGAEINKSLLALKECIRALGRKGAHLPFRVSKLTQVLRDSFIGEKSKTCMIAMMSPGLNSCEHSLNTLRYANRVKELSALDPASAEAQKISNRREREYDDEEEDMMDSESDLAHLRSLNEGDMSGEMLTFHETISKVQEAEEEVVEFQKIIVDSNNRWLNSDKALLIMTNQVDYDQDAYTQQLEELCTEKISMLTELRNKVVKFRNYLAEEETISRKITSAAPNSRR